MHAPQAVHHPSDFLRPIPAESQHAVARSADSRGPAFTLLELLVVIAILSILAGTLLPSLAKAKKAGARVREMSACQQLLTAYALYANDNRALVLPGYAPAFMVSLTPPPNQPQLEVFDDQGAQIFGVRAQRYPWRLAPYMDYNLSGLYKDEDLLHRYRERSDFQYVASLSPSLGINADFVGGKGAPGFGFNAAALRTWGAFYITRSDQPLRPDTLIVFASARGVDPDGGDPAPGFYEIDSPSLVTRRWTAARFNEFDAPDAIGFLHPRYDGKAVIGAFDGHSTTLSPQELDDMRRWSNRATRPDWTLGGP